MSLIKFLSHGGTYGCFSNFSPHTVAGRGVVFPTAQHYFQAMKFIRSPKDFDDVLRARLPHIATVIGNDKKRPLRPDWETVKTDVLYEVLHAKFEQNRLLGATLRKTKEAELVEIDRKSEFWGMGPNGTGQNMMGKTLMRVRRDLEAQENKKGIPQSGEIVTLNTGRKTTKEAGGGLASHMPAHYQRQQNRQRERNRLTHDDFM